MVDRLFRDRGAAGAALAERLSQFPTPPDTLVLGLPRGGVPVAKQVAEALYLELEVLNLRKLGLPDHPEVAMGATMELAKTLPCTLTRTQTGYSNYSATSSILRMGIAPIQRPNG